MGEFPLSNDLRAEPVGPQMKDDVYSPERPLRGLCFSFHHLNAGAVGSRRFRNLVKQLDSREIHLDVVSGRVTNEQSDPRVVPADNFAPFSTLLGWLSRIRSRSIANGSPGVVTPTLGTADHKVLSDETMTEDRSLRSLLLSFESLPDGDSGWILPAIWAGLRRKGKYNFVVSTAPPWSSHLAAIVVGKLRGLPVILDDRDPWAGSPGRMLYMTHPWMRRLDRWLAAQCYRRAAGIVCVTEPSCRLHQERSYGSKMPIVCLPNGFDPELTRRAAPPAVHDHLVISYAGSLYHGRSPLVVLKPALSLPEEIARDLHFHFVGNISESEAEAINRMQKPFEVTLHGAQSHEFCLDMVGQSDVCLLLAIGQPSQVPAKLYEYIGLGRPVLSVSDRGDATMKELEGQDWAWTCAVEDENGLRTALIDIHRKWKNHEMPRVDEAIARRFSFAKIAADYAAFTRTVVGNRSRGRKYPVQIS
ncbi:MAG: glycosyltransferase [candidate division Zixibacteria bacterium]|nr:glycosyltransferase [candidate division Zixibacteria bacterium]